MINCEQRYYYDPKTELCHVYDLPKHIPIDGGCDVGSTRDDMEHFLRGFMEVEARGGWVDCICEGCLKPGKGYLEPLPDGVVRIGIPHWICPECIAKWRERNNKTLESD